MIDYIAFTKSKIGEFAKKIMKQEEYSEICHNLYHIPYLKQESIPQLNKHTEGNHCQIWNLSQYPYSPQVRVALQQYLNMKINEATFVCYANIPFLKMISIIQEVRLFLGANSKHKVYIHCQDNKSRSAVFFAVYLLLTKAEEDIAKAILRINRCLKISIEENSSKYQSQHIMLTNVLVYIQAPSIINPYKLRILRMIVKNPPFLAVQGLGIVQKVILEIRVQDKLLSRVLLEELKGDALIFQFQEQCVCSDDFVMIIKYAAKGKAYSMFRVQLNTNFIYKNMARIHEKRLDISSNCQLRPQHPLLVDLFFQQSEKPSELSLMSKGYLPQANLLEAQQKPLSKETKYNETGQKQPAEAFEILDQESVEQNIEPAKQTDMDEKIKKIINNIGQDQECNKEEQDFEDYVSKLEQDAENSD